MDGAGAQAVAENKRPQGTGKNLRRGKRTQKLSELPKRQKAQGLREPLPSSGRPLEGHFF